MNGAALIAVYVVVSCQWLARNQRLAEPLLVATTLLELPHALAGLGWMPETAVIELVLMEIRFVDREMHPRSDQIPGV
ncbi:hypothetical protein BC832DRAFT_559661 [Gaertneriomyces semiglobifer]|nr:hypothetical protein BC832DRAFT_559661 [Gaertneriomyces semiglobifer]